MPLARVDDLVYDFNSNVIRVLFSGGLHQNPPHEDYNFFQSFGLIENASPHRDFNAAIGKFEIEQAGSINFYIRTPKKGPPTVGDKTPLRDVSDVRERPSDTVQSCVFTSPGEEVGTTYGNAIVHAPKYEDLMVSIREWWDHMEFEEIMCKMAGFRGNQDGYEVFEEKQADLPNGSKASALSNIDNMPAEWKRIHDANNITAPTRLLNSWTSPLSTNANADPAYGGVARFTEPFPWLYDLRSWLKKRSRARDGIGLKAAKINLPAVYENFKATKAQPNQYVLMVSTEVANLLMNTDQWQKHQNALIQQYGLDQGITTGFIGKIANIVIADIDLMPRFKVGTQQFTRGLIFGQQSMVCAYHTHKIPVAYTDPKRSTSRRSGVLMTPYSCWVEDKNKHTNSELICRAEFGSKVVSYPKPGTLDANADTTQKQFDPYGTRANQTRIDRGRVAIDFYESKT